MKLSIIIPVRNEKFLIKKIVDQLQSKLKILSYEIVFIDDFSTDNTTEIIKELIKTYPQIKIYNNKRKGLGGAITEGINDATGEVICIMMSDLSDSIDDLEKYYNIIKDEGVDAVFGSRFIEGSKVANYPKKKLILNRIFNIITKLLFMSNYNDFTNAFKIYKKDALLKAFPLVSESFNIFLELPLKIISRKMKYKIIPISWINRKEGASKFDIKELRAKYLFTLIYCLLEKILLKK
jgi:dolichol-phosphate mannosyltransferase